MSLSAGIARRIITPTANVELAGLGYYLNRTAERVRDHLTATAFVVANDAGKSVALIALDLMYNSTDFTTGVRAGVAARTGIKPESICVNFSHTHNGPTAGFARGLGEVNADYLKFATQQAIDAAVEAWKEKRPVRLYAGAAELCGFAFNRTRDNGPVDTRLGLLRADTLDGKPMALVVNYHCHLNAHMDFDLRAVSRDWSGEMLDQLEAALPGVMAMYLQGTCGDVMVAQEFRSTARRFEVAQQATRAALAANTRAKPVLGDEIASVTRRILLPTRRWTRGEVLCFRTEGLHRLKTGDTTDWLNGLARSIVTFPPRLPLRYGGSVEKAVAAISRFAVEWSEEMLVALNSRPEIVETEVQALRVGNVWFAANESEFYTTLGLETRRSWPHEHLFMLGYSNGCIGYLPDAHDIELKSYAAEQSPKFTGQFPFTPASGPAMIRGLLDALEQVAAPPGKRLSIDSEMQDPV